MAEIKVGQDVFIHDLQQHGTAEEVVDGVVTAVRVLTGDLETPTKVINTIGMAVTVLGLLKDLWEAIKSLFHHHAAVAPALPDPMLPTDKQPQEVLPPTV
jgi:hypothetical protein